ncbi:ABC transporter substrate-binding protein [Ideonella margarita]|uniref:ABC transporter substrate-binding protein n=1 Tax=Ideonella margarita TaxID=2984191 RepID=A0ABU9C345_9BURK
MRTPPLRHGRLLACLLLAALCGVAQAQASAARPIKVGALSALSGPTAFPEAPRAAKAYFDAVNAAGGVHGRRIEYLSLDEMPDLASAARAAERLLSDPEVVALAGGSGLLDCAANAQRYAAADLMVLQGASVAPQCFSTSHIVPVNNGPYTGLASALLFARQQLGSPQPCIAMLDLPGMRAGYQQALDQLARQTGQVSPPLRAVGLQDDPREALREFERQGCRSIVFTGHEAAVPAWLQAARSLGLRDRQWLFLTPAYTSALARSLPTDLGPVYVMAEFEPWSGSSLPLLDWKRLMRQAGLPASSLSQGGYLAAQHLVKVLMGLKGPITRASVSEALRQHPPLSHPMLGMPLAIGRAGAHNPNRSALPMQLIDGAWRVAATQWIQVPASASP